MKTFEYVYWTFPIDFWSGAQEADRDETESVLEQMPEPTRDETVYKLYLPYPGGSRVSPVYLCKAHNNGTVHIFSHWPLESLFGDIERIRA